MNKQKTILNFFSKSPANKSSSACTPSKLLTPERSTNGTNSEKKVNKTPGDVQRNSNGKLSSTKVEVKTPVASEKNRVSSVDTSVKCSEDSEKKPVKKRKRIILQSDSDSDYSPENESIEVSLTETSPEKSPTDSSKKKKKRKESLVPSLSQFKSPCHSPSQKTVSTESPNVPKRSASNKTLEVKESNEETKFTHEKYNFLQKYLKEDGTLVDDGPPEIDTTNIPPSFWKSLTPAMKQWWGIKLKHFDTIIFFKVGKFYELYHMDAVVGVKELGLIFMKGELAHSGFPEISYGRYSECLVEKGYRVARVEQVETPQMAEERCKKNQGSNTKSDKVVERAVCQITTRGTRTLTYQEENIGSNNNFLLAVCSKHQAEGSDEFGICFIDTTIGKFTIGQFTDDRHGSRLLTLIARYPPVEVLYCESSSSKKTLQLLNRSLNGVQCKAAHFHDSRSVLKNLQKTNCFNVDDATVVFPDALDKMLDKTDLYQTTALKEYELAVQALGACSKYLETCCIQDRLLTMRLIEEYIPLDKVPKEARRFEKAMVLDGASLQNLDIVHMQPSADTEGTLFGAMDYCCTSFGRRLLRDWMCSPACNPDVINDRLNCVEELSEMNDLTDVVKPLLRELPDLERILSKIHSYGLKRASSDPNERAILYEANIYNKRKIGDFLSALNGLKLASKIAERFEPHMETIKSHLLKDILTVGGSGRFPDMTESLSSFDDAFDHEIALKEGNILPRPGVDSEYDAAVKDIDTTTEELDDILKEAEDIFHCKVKYVGSGKSRYLLEVPDHKRVPGDFDLQGSRKGFKRYATQQTREALAQLVDAEERRASALRDGARRLFARFDDDYKMWKTAADCMATLDVLVCLCTYYKSSEVPMCRPQFFLPSDSQEPFFEIINGRHPTFLKYFTGNDYIPNSVYIGSKRDSDHEDLNEGGKVVLVTGPNMGGKSTLMRQAGTLAIMAHMGSYVPAESMKLTPIDRIFTRVGAGDQISKGESTFYVETSETASILNHASEHSFVLVDELGRGTATYDGTAIAYAVLRYLVDDIKCRTLFSTHYHSLVDDFSSHPNVGLGHMACMVENSDSNLPLEKITFLYNFVNGACPKSYGFNVALLAGITEKIVHEGFLKAKELELRTRFSRVLKRLLSVTTPEKIIQEISRNKILSNGC